MLPPKDMPAHPATGKGLWCFSAILALSLHLTFAGLAYVQMLKDAEDDDLGAPGIELGLELASPKSPPADLPPGLESEASAAAPEATEQATIKDADLPKETPVESDDPDRLVAVETAEKPVIEPLERTANPVASEGSVAQETKAAPSIEAAVETPKAVTVDQGTGESRQRIRVTWQRELLAHLDKHKRYPADRIQKATTVVVSISLDRIGRVVSAGIARASGDESFDAAALAMVQRANPMPAPPQVVADEGLSFTLPVVFRIGKKR